MSDTPSASGEKRKIILIVSKDYHECSEFIREHGRERCRFIRDSRDINAYTPDGAEVAYVGRYWMNPDIEEMEDLLQSRNFPLPDNA